MEVWEHWSAVCWWTLNAGTVSSGTASGGDISLTAGAGVAEIGGSVTITGGTASEANGGDVTIVSGAGTAGGSGGDVFINTGSGVAVGVIQLQLDSTEALSIEVDGTLSVPVTIAGGGSYESQVTDDDDIPNKKYVDDNHVTLVLPPIIANIAPTAKAGVGALGAGMAIHPPGSFAFITDDATGPSPFILAYVDAGPSWVRSDTLALIS